DLRAGRAHACGRARTRGRTGTFAGIGGGIMIGRVSFAVLAATIVATSASAQTSPAAPDTLPLTLDDAVRRAVEHNPDLAVVKLATEVEAAHVGEARTAYTPVFSTTLGRSSAIAPSTNFLLGTQGVDTRDWFSSTGIRQRIPWGNGTWSVSWDASR